ncbi:MAG TPA: DUF5655 domain-containing protein [Bacteroidia bacterium]|nr:DUF5655 domain-containing protein [Bacteroidia bacterium]
MKKTKQNQKKNSEGNQTTSSQNVNVIFRNMFHLKGTSLLPLNEGQVDSEKSIEKKFRSVKELEQIILKNSRILFGERTFLIPISKKEESLFAKGFVPKGLLLDLGNILKPRFYFLDIVLSGDNFYAHIFPRITKFMACFKSQAIMEKMYKILAQNKSLKKDLKGKISYEGIADLVKTAISKPFVLYVSDNVVKEFVDEIKNAYAEINDTVKCVLIRKFAINGKAICTIAPPLFELHLNGKKRTPNAPVTEEFHFEGVSDEVKAIYGKIKTELLRTSRNLEFNPQRYYVSMRKNKNVAFFHFTKKRITLVVKCAEKETRKQIKHHEVKTLTEKVQKFWGAASCSIVIENEKYLQEVTGLLKKLIAE